MKNFRCWFFISFVSYALMLVTVPFVKEAPFSPLHNLFLYLFLFSCLYQFIYIIYLRKKDEISLGKSIADFFFGSLSSFWCFWIVSYINTFVNGFMDCNEFLQIDCDGPYYGFEAWKRDEFSNNVVFLFLIIYFIYLKFYYKKNKQTKKSIN